MLIDTGKIFVNKSDKTFVETDRLSSSLHDLLLYEIGIGSLEKQSA